jgi:hypothetical protein
MRACDREALLALITAFVVTFLRDQADMIDSVAPTRVALDTGCRRGTGTDVALRPNSGGYTDRVLFDASRTLCSLRWLAIQALSN